MYGIIFELYICGTQLNVLFISRTNVKCDEYNNSPLIFMYNIGSFTGPNQTWEIGRVSMKTRRYVGNREGKNHYGI